MIVRLRCPFCATPGTVEVDVFDDVEVRCTCGDSFPVTVDFGVVRVAGETISTVVA